MKYPDLALVIAAVLLILALLLTGKYGEWYLENRYLPEMAEAFSATKDELFTGCMMATDWGEETCKQLSQSPVGLGIAALVATCSGPDEPISRVIAPIPQTVTAPAPRVIAPIPQIVTAPAPRETYNERTNSDSMESGAATDEEEGIDPMELLIAPIPQIVTAPAPRETYNERTNSDSMESGAATDEEEGIDPMELLIAPIPQIVTAPAPRETYNERTNSDSMESGAATDEEESTDPYGLEWLLAFNDRLANKPELTMWDMPSAYRTISNPSGFILEIEDVLDDGHALGRTIPYGNSLREIECGFILENDYSDEYRGGIEMLYVLFPDDSTMMFMIGGEYVLYSEDDYSVILRPIADSSDVAPARSTTTTSTDVVSPQPSQSISVSKWDTGKPWYGEKWPFTMSSGTIELVGCCSVIFKCEGIVYAINGTARQDIARTGWTDIYYSPLWRDHPSGGKVLIVPLITLALSLRR